MTFTAAELDSAIENFRAWEDGWDFLHYEEYELPTTLGLVKQVEHGKDYVAEYEFSLWMIVTLDGRFFKKTGYYASFDGAHWDGELVEVEKKQVTREEWVEV